MKTCNHNGADIGGETCPICQAKQLQNENNILRAIVARTECVYGHRDSNGICRLGYPGCACADDIMIGDDMGIKSLVERLRAAEEKLKNSVEVRRLPVLYDCICGQQIAFTVLNAAGMSEIEKSSPYECPLCKRFFIDSDYEYIINLALKDDWKKQTK